MRALVARASRSAAMVSSRPASALGSPTSSIGAKISRRSRAAAMSGRKKASLTPPSSSSWSMSATSGATRPRSLATATTICCWSGASAGDVAHAAAGRASTSPRTAGRRARPAGAGGTAWGGRTAARAMRASRPASPASPRADRRAGRSLGATAPSTSSTIASTRYERAGPTIARAIRSAPSSSALELGEPGPQPQEGRLGVEVAADVRQALGDL